MLLLVEVMDGDGVLLSLADPSASRATSIFADAAATQAADAEFRTWLKGGPRAPLTPHGALVLLAWGAVLRLLHAVQGTRLWVSVTQPNNGCFPTTCVLCS